MRFLPYVLSAALLAGAVALEALGVWLLTQGFVLGFGAAHVGAAGLCGEGLYHRGHALGEEARRRLCATGWLIGFFVPPFGPLAAVGLALLQVTSGSRPPAALSQEKRREKAAQAALERKRQQQQFGSGLDAIVDALKDRDAKVRVAAMEALQGDDSAQAVKLLSESRDNTVFDVRIRAVEGLARISKQYNDRISAAKKAVAATPDAPARHVELAKLCLTYGGLDVEDAEVRKGLLELAVTHARRGYELAPDDRTHGLLLADALRACARFREAEEVYRQLVQLDNADVEALMGVVETQFLQKNLAKLPDTCRWVLQRIGHLLDDESAESLKFWVRTG